MPNSCQKFCHCSHDSWLIYINFIFSQGVQGLQTAPERLGDAARCLWSARKLCRTEAGSSLWPTSASECHWLESADSGGIWWAVGERGVKPWRPWRQNCDPARLTLSCEAYAGRTWGCGVCRCKWDIFTVVTVVPQNGHFALEHHFFNRPIYFPLNFQTNPWVNEISSW